MQWEVSANRLLTASRVAHYRDSWPGSCSGVWSHLPLPSFGFLLWGAWWFASERGDSGSAPRTEEQMELRLEEHKLLQDRSVGQNWCDLWQNWGNWDVWSSFRKHRGPYEIFNFCEWRKTRLCEFTWFACGVLQSVAVNWFLCIFMEIMTWLPVRCLSTGHMCSEWRSCLCNLAFCKNCVNKTCKRYTLLSFKTVVFINVVFWKSKNVFG